MQRFLLIWIIKFILNVRTATNLSKIRLYYDKEVEGNLKKKLDMLVDFFPSRIESVEKIDVSTISLIEKWNLGFLSFPSVVLLNSDKNYKLFNQQNYDNILGLIAKEIDDYIVTKDHVTLNAIKNLEPKTYFFKSAEQLQKFCPMDQKLCVFTQLLTYDDYDVIQFNENKKAVKLKLKEFKNIMRIKNWTSDRPFELSVSRKNAVIFHKIKDLSILQNLLDKIDYSIELFYTTGDNPDDNRLIKYIGIDDVSNLIIALEFNHKKNVLMTISKPSAKYIYNSIKNNSQQEWDLAIDWIQRVFNGKEKPYLKSEESIPYDPSKTYVIPLVASEFEEKILNSQTDSFVDYYAPWCGHCRLLAPVILKVAQVMKNSDIDHIKFYKMDATINDTPNIMIDSFPKIVYYKVGSKNFKIINLKEHNASSIIEEIGEISTKKFNVNAVISALDKVNYIDVPERQEDL